MPSPILIHRLNKPDYAESIVSLFGLSSIIGYWPLGEAAGSIAHEFSARKVEMLANGGFETAGGGGADIWGTWTETAGDGALADEAVLFQAGAHAAKITAGATANTKVDQTIVVRPGMIYGLSFWTRGDATNAGRYLVRDVTNAADIIATTSTGIAGTTYTRYEINFVAPAACISVRIDIMCPAANGGIAYFDSVSVMGGTEGIYSNVGLNAGGIGDGRSSGLYDGSTSFTNVYSAVLASAFNSAEHTLAIWIKFASVSVWTDTLNRAQISMFVDANNRTELVKAAGNNTYAFVHVAGGTIKVYNHSPISFSDWWFACITISKSADTKKDYVNGVQVGSTLTALGNWSGGLPSNGCVIGARQTTPTIVNNGLLAHALLLNRAATAVEIATAYQMAF